MDGKHVVGRITKVDSAFRDEYNVDVIEYDAKQGTLCHTEAQYRSPGDGHSLRQSHRGKL